MSASNPSAFSANRQAIRQRMLALRNGMDAEERARANPAIQQSFLGRFSPEWRTLLIYVSQPEEVATIPLILELLRQKKRVCIPAFDRAARAYFPSELRDFQADLRPGQLGILEPKPEARRPVAVDDLDVIFLPGLAFDRAGNRLGHGRGYFDRLCHGARAVKIALAYHFQIVDAIEVQPRDVPMHEIITEKEVIRCQRP